ncbi:MAG: hypothetical protein NC489_45965 [Ruminococcus flavefaciens]|nr:hypothetical protein [Ruminococcus flavefaciens]
MFGDKTIGERFAELRKSKKDAHGKEMPVFQLARELVDGKYIENYEINVIRQEIGKVENKGKFPQLFLIKGYCGYFNVTSDYLLGLRNSKPVDEDIAMISKSTGLSGESVQMLKLMNDKENTLYAENKKNLLMLDFILSSFYDNENRSNTNLYFTVLRKMWDYITLNPDNIGYGDFDKNGEYIIKDTVYTTDKEHIENGNIGISHPLKIGELYKYQLERELLENIKKLEIELKKHPKK